MTSESTRFLGQPRETKPTIGFSDGSIAAATAAGAEIWGDLLTTSIVPRYEEAAHFALSRLKVSRFLARESQVLQGRYSLILLNKLLMRRGLWNFFR
ncbi:MAG TPA: hypothetical protein VIY09_07085, partial [Rhizomicrobium sp.]